MSRTSLTLAIAPSASGGDGPGVVVAVGDKLFALEFSGMGSGPDEKTRLLTLAHQAAGRVH